MSEWVGFQGWFTFTRGGIALLILLPFGLIGAGVHRSLQTSLSTRYLAIALLIGFFAGISTAELYLLRDEAQFASEVTRVQSEGKRTYVRPRSWPNKNAALVWDKETGMHATD